MGFWMKFLPPPPRLPLALRAGAQEKFDSDDQPGDGSFCNCFAVGASLPAGRHVTHRSSVSSLRYRGAAALCMPEMRFGGQTDPIEIMTTGYRAWSDLVRSVYSMPSKCPYGLARIAAYGRFGHVVTPVSVRCADPGLPPLVTVSPVASSSHPGFQCDGFHQTSPKQWVLRQAGGKVFQAPGRATH